MSDPGDGFFSGIQKAVLAAAKEYLEQVEPVKKRGKQRAAEPENEHYMRAMQAELEKKRGKKRAAEPENEHFMQAMIVMSQDIHVMTQAFQELKHLIVTYLLPSTHLGAPAVRNVIPIFRLQFVNKLPDTIFTKDNIRDEKGGFVEIQLINTASLVVKEGDLSSIRVEILVLEGELGFEVHEDWTEQKFSDKIVHKREDKGSLVKGEKNITLTGGVGTIVDLSFTGISRWKKGKKFRLGARVLQSSRMGQVRIMEAISEAFEVMDCRSKTNKKNKLPSLDDNTATTVPPLHQGSSGLQNNSNRASSSQYPPENSQDLTLQQPPAMSIPSSQVQLTLNNDNHQPDIDPLGVFHSFPSPNFMTGSTQIYNEPHTQFFADHEQYPPLQMFRMTGIRL